MSLLQRALILFLLAGAAGLLHSPILAALFAVAGLLLIDGIIISSLWRLIFRRKE